ncbi:MAG: hypothetical protein MI863_28400 [Desulfobacterales bacterium]|nr:hypothetical protein [Desulfobacterales bacterium]
MKVFNRNIVPVCLGLVLTLFLPGPVLSGSDIINADCPGQVTCLVHKTSRSRLCLDLSDNRKECVVTGMVGGEHITTVEVTGRPGDSIQLEFKTLTGTPGYTISGDNASIHRLGQGEVRIKLGPDSPLIEISLSAHPYGEFEMRLKKRDPLLPN